MKPLVGITIVTFNSGRFIRGCLEETLLQDHEAVEIVVVDNASQDATCSLLRAFEGRDRVRIIYNSVNTGFARAQNQAIAALPDAEWILTLNPDVRLPANFVSRLLSAGGARSDVGSICGKLLAVDREFRLASPPLLDSTGMYFTSNLRHLDRGSRVADRGQYDAEEFVFGGTAAACLYRQTMIHDIEIFGEFFDGDFFAYREDADVAWRAQLLAWKCMYTPSAVALHIRTAVPENRRSLPAFINRHSVKNRWLLRIKNTTGGLYRQLWLPVTLRDIVVIGGCLLREWSSLGAFWMLAKLMPRAWRKRREIMRRKRASEDEMRRWFSDRPVSFPVETTR